MAILTHHRIAVLVTDGFEESELLEPLRALRAEGAEVDIISTHDGIIRGMHTEGAITTVEVDRVLSESVRSDQYDGLLLPGGKINSGDLRSHPLARKFVAAIQEEEKPIAAICHAPWLLIAAGLVRGRKLTSYPGIKNDLMDAGAHWVDQEVVSDENLVSSRTPADLPAFISAMVSLFARKHSLISPETRHLLARSRIA